MGLKHKIFITALSFFFIGIPFVGQAACCEWIYNNVTRCRDIANDESGKKWCITPAGSMPVAGSFYRNGKCNLKTSSKFAEEGSCDKGFELQVPFPGFENVEKASGKPELLATYIVAIFRFGVWIAISFSIFMIMLAGFMWLTSAGNQTSITRAKGYITNAIVGLVIALLSFTILQTINPRLTELKLPGLEKVKRITDEKACCFYNTETFEMSTPKPRGAEVDDKGKPVGPAQTCDELLTELKKIFSSLEMCPSDIGPCCVCTETGLSWNFICYKNVLTQASCRAKEVSYWNPLKGDISFCTLVLDKCENFQGSVKRPIKPLGSTGPDKCSTIN